MISLVDLLMTTKLFEMAYHKKDAIDKISNISPNISRELLKILMYQESKNRSHWKSKINGWLNDVSEWSDIKKGKRLDSKILFEKLFNEPLEDLDQLIKKINRIESEYYGKSRYINYSDLNLLHSNIKNIYKQIIQDIFQNKNIDINNYI